MPISNAELILNPDNSIYHLGLLPQDIADTIFTVGDPYRVGEVSCYFDRIDIKKQKREFVTHTGYIGSQRFTVMSTGMSTDNIDIVFNELDALVNINLETRQPNSLLKSLKIIRIGTAGGLQKSIDIDSFVTTEYAIGLEGLADFYKLDYNHNEKIFQKNFFQHFQTDIKTAYAIQGDNNLTARLARNSLLGNTVTCPGFYGPQGRILRAAPKIKNFAEKLTAFGMHNFEMETAGIYALGRILGHQCCSISAIVANRVTGQFSKDLHKTVDKLIKYVLDSLCI